MNRVHILFSPKRIILFRQDNSINKIIYFLLINPAERGTRIL
jgi:hypothetical protein